MSCKPISIEDIRFWMFDRSPEDNPLTGDLEFTDEEILRGMEHAAREYNSIPPLVSFASAHCLPSDTNIFFEATAEMLYKMKLHSLSRNRFKYQAGNVAVDDEDPKIEALGALVKQMGDSWREAARTRKIAINNRGFYTDIT